MIEPLTGLRVWITRPQPAADASVRRWRAAQALADAVPCILLEPAMPGPEEQRAVLDAPAQSLVVLSSTNAAEHFVRVFGSQQPGGETWSCAALGEKTASVARELGLRLELCASRATGADLAAEILARARPVRAILPGSDQRRPEIEERLAAEGVEVISMTLYRNRPVQSLPAPRLAALKAGEVDALAFYSPSAVAALLEATHSVAGALRSLAALALGSTTAEAVRDGGLRLVAVPDEPGESKLLEATGQWWSAQRGAG